MIDTKLLKKSVRTFLDISTSHIDYSDDELLGRMTNPSDFGLTQADEIPMTVYDNSGFGYSILVDTDELNKNGVVYIQTLQKCGFTAAFTDILIAANKLGCAYVRFDSIGNVIKGLPEFDW